MLLRELFEAEKKVAVAAFGRMNPPTIGHAKLVDKIKSVDGDHYLFLSQTQKPKDNPLDFTTKLSFAKKFFPEVNVGHEKVRTPIQMLQMLEQLGYTDIVYVAGSDRVAQFEKLFNDYNGKEYNFNSIQVVSAGERDPDADGAEGMSASKMRAAAKQGDFESFKQGVPDQGSAEKMYDAVRTGMGVKEPEMAEDVSPEDEDKFHNELDDLVHKYFGDSPDEEKMKKKYRKTVEKAPPGREDQVKALKKEFPDDEGAPYAIAWAQHNKKKNTKKVKEAHPNQQFSIYNPDSETYKGKKIYNKSKYDALDLPTTDEIPDNEYTPDLDKDELKKVIAKSLKNLTSREKQILHMRFEKDMTLDQIGKVLGVSNDRARQIEQRALRKLRHPSRSDDLRPFLESDVVLDRTSLRTYIKDMIVDYLEREDDIEKLSKILKMVVGKTVKHRGSRYQVTSEDIVEACKYGSYFCSTDNKTKCRQGPKKSRG